MADGNARRVTPDGVHQSAQTTECWRCGCDSCVEAALVDHLQQNERSVDSGQCTTGGAKFVECLRRQRAVVG